MKVNRGDNGGHVGDEVKVLNNQHVTCNASIDHRILSVTLRKVNSRSGENVLIFTYSIMVSVIRFRPIHY